MPPFFLGLTGSIGMGKSTTAKLFAERGCPVWDADASVHRVYQKGAAGFEAIRDLVPDAATGHAVDRTVLRDAILKNNSLLKDIEAVVHPLVAADRETFKTQHAAPVLVFDVPLLFETNAQDQFHAVACVATHADEQKRRVLARPGMTEEVFQTILAKQRPSAEKQALADYVIDTTTMQSAQADVDRVLAAIQEQRNHA